MPSNHLKYSEQEIEEAILIGANGYFDQCRQQVPYFIDRNFHYPGAWQTNKVALGRDMLLAPLNLFWAPCYAVACLLRYITRKMHLPRLYNLLNRCPGGMKTEVQIKISGLIYRELLEPEQQNNCLEAHILRSLNQLQTEKNVATNKSSLMEINSNLGQLLKDALDQYGITRTASADITNTFTCTVLGAFTFQKFTPGALGIGVMVAAEIAKEISAKSFILGPLIGDIYYSWFPPEPSLPLQVGSTLAIITLLSIFASFSGLLTDPIQAAIGVHKRRLNKMLNHLQADFIQKTRGSFRPKDQFIARFLDMFDAIKTNIT